jgi:hypothetical protein
VAGRIAHAAKGGVPMSVKQLGMGVVVGIAALWIYDKFVRGRI